MPKRRASEAIKAFMDAGRGINVSELAEELISAFGGARSFAAEYHHEYEHGTKPGGIARSKMLDGVLRIITAAGSQNKGKGNDISSFSDEELKEELLRILHKNSLGEDDASEKEEPLSAS